MKITSLAPQATTVRAPVAMAAVDAPQKEPSAAAQGEAVDSAEISSPKEKSRIRKMLTGTATGVALGAMVSAAAGVPMMPALAVGTGLGAVGALNWLDKYTSPRPNTAGNFDKASYFQASLQGGTEGYYLLGSLSGSGMGIMGVGAGAGSAMMGALVENKSGSQLAGLLAGTGTGVGLAAGTAALLGGPIGPAMFMGGLIGLFQTIRAHGESAVRDAGGNATMVSGLFMNGPGKVAGGVGAALGVRAGKAFEELHEKYGKDMPVLKNLETKTVGKIGQGLVGATIGAAVAAGMVVAFGGTLAAMGFPVTLGTAVAASAGAGMVGPFIGPRFSQFFRNLAEDIGKGVDWVYTKARGEQMDPKKANAVGSVPSSFLKEGIRGQQYMDGGLSSFVSGLLIGGVMESIQQIHIMLKSKTEKIEDGDGTTPPLAVADGSPNQSDEIKQAA